MKTPSQRHDGWLKKITIFVLRAALFLGIFYNANGALFDQTQLTQDIERIYFQGQAQFRDELSDDMMEKQDFIKFCSITNHYKSNYQTRWDILSQLELDTACCLLYKAKFKLQEQYTFPPILDLILSPTIIPSVSRGSIGFPFGIGENRDSVLASFDQVSLKNHCELVKKILFVDYIPEFRIIDQLLIDNNFCTKTDVVNKLKLRVTLSNEEEQQILENKLDYQILTNNPPPKPNDFSLPWTNCRLVINEFNTNTPNSNIGQFIEFSQVCHEGKWSRQDSLDGFRVLVIKGETNEIIMSQTLDGQTLNLHKEGRKRVKMFTIGANGVPRSNLNFAHTAIAEGSEYLPIGQDSPYSIVLLFGNPQILNVLDLPKLETLYKPLHLTGELTTLIKGNLQDIVVYGTTPIHQKCIIFEEIYPPFAASDCTDSSTSCLKYLHRDWQNPNSADKSLSRCTLNMLPILPEAFLYTEPTPGLTNDCEHGFPFQMDDHIADISNVLERVVGTNPTDQNCRSELYTPMTYNSVQASKYQTRFEQSEADWAGMSFNSNIDQDAVLDMEIDIMEDSIVAVGGEPHISLLSCSAENPYDQHPIWKEQIQQHQSNLLDLKTFEDCKVKPWIWYFSNPSDPQRATYGCKFCADMVAKGYATIRPGKIEKIMRPGGTLIYEGNRIPWRNSNAQLRHPEHPYHKLAMHFIREQEWYSTEEALVKAMEQPGSPMREYYRATEEIQAAVYQSVKMNLSFQQYESFIRYIKNRLNGNVGIHYHDSKSMQKISLMISTEMHNRLVNHLLKNKPEISIILDSSDDNEGRHYMTVLFQTLDTRSRPHIYFYKLLEIGVSETADELFKLLWDSINADGLQAYFREKLRGYSSDGAAVVKSKLLRLIKQKINPNIIGNHCAAHRLDLVTKHAFESFPFIEKLDDVVNDQYNFLNGRSLKLHAKLREVIEKEHDTFFKLHKLFPVRWISSKFETIMPILQHWATLIAAYISISTDSRFKKNQKEKALNLKAELLKRPVIATLTKVEDICDLFKTFSKNFQEDSITPIPFKEYKNSLHTILENQKTMNGQMTQKFFDRVRCEKNGQEIFPCTLKDYEDKDTKVTYFNHELEYVNDPDYPKLSESLPNYIDALHAQLLKYFPDDIFDSFGIFYPKSLPASEAIWNDYGTEELKALKKVFNWQFSDQEMLRDWKYLIDSIRSKGKFQKIQEKQIHDFWYYNYNDAQDIKWTSITREIIRTIQIIPGSTASAERIFSLLNIIKSSLRSSLSPENLDALLRIKYNGPDCIHDVDFFSYTKIWCKDHATADDSTRGSYKPADYKKVACQQCNAFNCEGGVLFFPSAIF